MNKSEINIAAIGNKNPKRLSLKRAVPNNAMAPIAVKFAGWGKKRVAAAMAIRIAAVIPRLKLFLFIIASKIIKKKIEGEIILNRGVCISLIGLL